MRTYTLVVCVILIGALTSCNTSKSTIKKDETKVAGYTLKGKKELMHQKVLHVESKTIIANP